MKVNYENTQASISIVNIPVGEVFFAERNSTKSKKGTYMKIDANCGLIRNRPDKNYAINLETGQPREFNCDALVYKVNAEVIFP